MRHSILRNSCLHGLPSSWGSTLTGNNLLPFYSWEQIFFSMHSSHILRASLSKEANWKSQRLFLFVKMAEKLTVFIQCTRRMKDN